MSIRRQVRSPLTLSYSLFLPVYSTFAQIKNLLGTSSNQAPASLAVRLSCIIIDLTKLCVSIYLSSKIL